MSADPGLYRDARELFEAAAEASRDARRLSLRLQEMSAREGVRAQSYAARGRSGSVGGGMSATESRIDWEAAHEARLREDYELVDLAFVICYGTDGTGGVRRLLNGEYADALCMHYVDGMPWETVARRLKLAPSTVRTRANVALDSIDTVGYELAIEGVWERR